MESQCSRRPVLAALMGILTGARDAFLMTAHMACEWQKCCPGQVEPLLTHLSMHLAQAAQNNALPRT